jgi:hypothetical protein
LAGSSSTTRTVCSGIIDDTLPQHPRRDKRNHPGVTWPPRDSVRVRQTGRIRNRNPSRWSPVRAVQSSNAFSSRNFQCLYRSGDVSHLIICAPVRLINSNRRRKPPGGGRRTPLRPPRRDHLKGAFVKRRRVSLGLVQRDRGEADRRAGIEVRPLPVVQKFALR